MELLLEADDLVVATLVYDGHGKNTSLPPSDDEDQNQVSSQLFYGPLH